MTPTLYKVLREVKQTITDEVQKTVAEKRTPADTAASLTAKVDIDIAKWILAETVKANDWDGRYSARVKAWAKQLYIPALHSEDGRKYGAFDGPHPVHINQLIEAIIKTA